MSRTYRAASLAVAALCTAFGVASAPSFAETVVDTVTADINYQQLRTVPAVEPLPAQLPGEADLLVDTVEPEAPEPKPATLAQLVAMQDLPTELDSEAECLAASVYFESKGEPLEGQLAVAEVVINRSESGRFAPSICKVVFQKGQFSFVRSGGFPPINKASRGWREAVAISQIAMEDAWESRASNALFFHARRVSPRWNKTRVAQLGNHVFYR